jgi:NTE family protein
MDQDHARIDRSGLTPPQSTPRSRELTKTHRDHPRPEFGHIHLLLQGGGALGAYQGGVYEALAEADLHPDWVAGISIGSINGAIIAGNPPDQRVAKLKAFWEGVTTQPFDLVGGNFGALLGDGDVARGLLNQMSAGVALLAGACGFFEPRVPSPWLQPLGSSGATSYFDTRQLKATLEGLVDFDRINSAHDKPRLSVGAVNVRSGNLIYFDSTTHVIRPEHVMASGALPPGFPAIEIEGEAYWDGGLVSNTPLQWVAMTQNPPDSLVFQVDLWSARGQLPRNLAEVATRQKEIQYSSRTRAFTDYFKDITRLRNIAAELLAVLPEDLKQDERARLLGAALERHAANIVQLIYRPKGYEGDSKDYEFSRRSMEEHWQAGYYDAVHTLRHPEIFLRPSDPYETLTTFDFRRDSDL